MGKLRKYLILKDISLDRVWTAWPLGLIAEILMPNVNIRGMINEKIPNLDLVKELCYRLAEHHRTLQEIEQRLRGSSDEEQNNLKRALYNYQIRYSELAAQLVVYKAKYGIRF